MKKEVGFPNLNTLPEMFLNALPVSIPKMEYKRGLLTFFDNFVHNQKVKQICTASALEASIASNRWSQVQSQFGIIREMVLFGEKYESERAAIRTARQMGEVQLKTAEAQLQNLQIKNLQEQIELQISQLDLKMRLKEAEYGSSETEDNGE